MSEYRPRPPMRPPGAPGPGRGPRLGRPVEKPKDFKGTGKKLLAVCRPFAVPMVAALLAAMGGSVFTVVGPRIIARLTDLISAGLSGGIDRKAVASTGGILAAFYVTGALLSLLQGFLMAGITQGIARTVRSDLARKIDRLPIARFEQDTLGDVLSRVTNDVDAIAQSFNGSLAGLATSATQLAGSLFMMLITDVRLTLVSVLSALAGLLLMRIIISNSRKFFADQQRYLGELNGHVEEIYTGHSAVRANNAEPKALETFLRINENLRNSAFKAQSLSGLMHPVMHFVGNLGYLSVCVAGAVLAQKGQIGFGVIVAFMMYVRYFTQPLSQIAQAAQGLQSAAAAGERVFEFLEAQEMPDESKKPRRTGPVRGRVEFRNVRFGYDPEKPVIKSFSALALPGQKIAVVGPTGAGKTTLVNLLMRFYDVQSGDILIDGVSIYDMSRRDVHDLFCMVLQDTRLFEGTVRENLIYCTENVTEDRMERACKAVGIHRFIRTLPKGYDTPLSEEVTLSAGQKQQLTIARAMIADRPMLILDEATSSVDTRTELHIQRAMDELMKNRTSFVIAHRLSTIRNADLILVLKDGDVAESGTHDELLARGGFYAELHNSQFDPEDPPAEPAEAL